MAIKHIGTFNKIRAWVILWVILQVAWILYILIADRLPDYSLFVLSSDSNFIMPGSLSALADRATDPVTRITTSAQIQVINNLVFWLFGMIVAYAIVLILRNTSSHRRMVNDAKSIDKEVVELSPSVSESHISLIEPGTGKWLHSPFHERYISIKRINPTEESSGTPIKRLNQALIDILMAYKDTPASNKGYHGNTSLLKHSIAVAKEAKKIASESNVKDPLLQAVCLAHDLEKIINYKQEENGEWVEKATHSRQVCTAILIALPEFKELRSTDRHALIRAVRYYHTPNHIPLDTVSRIKTLIKILSKADKTVTKRERQELPYKEEANQGLDEKIKEVFLEAIEQLNINNALESGRADGWTMKALPFVAVPEENIRNRLKNLADSQVINTLQLEIPFKREGYHPAQETIIKKLSEYGYLLTEYNGTATESGMFDIRNGSQKFTGVAFLSKEAIEKEHPGLLDTWGSSRYRMHIEKAYTPKSHKRTVEQ